MEKKQLWTVVHEHRHGVSDYIVECDRMPTEEEVIEHCNIDFEPERGEVITVAPLDLGKDIVKIP